MSCTVTHPRRPFCDDEGSNALSLAVVGGALKETLARHPPKAGGEEDEEGGELQVGPQHRGGPPPHMALESMAWVEGLGQQSRRRSAEG